MKKKEVCKPKSNFYKKIVKLTQSVLYVPQTEEWFCEKFPTVKEEDIKEALLYLCHTGHLDMLSDKTYAVNIDFRTRLRGIYHYDGGGGHVHVDSLRKLLSPVNIPQLWEMGAFHNDRVEIAIEGELSDCPEQFFGVVQRIVQPTGDFFVGRLQKIDGILVVLPEEKEVGNAILTEGEPKEKISGAYVFARLNHAESIRKNAEETADIRQKKRTITWSEISGSHDNEQNREQIEKTCTVIKTLKTKQELLLYRNGLYQEMCESAEKEILSGLKKRGKPVSRTDFTEVPSMLLSSQCAVNIDKSGKLLHISVHVPDLCDLFFQKESCVEKELLRKCMGQVFLPSLLKNKTGFSDGKVQKALTVSFDVDSLGQISKPEIKRSIILSKKESNPLYKQVLKLLPINGLSSNSLICAANDAAAMWFDDNDIAAPFVHVRFKENAEELLDAAKTAGLCEKADVTLENIHRIFKDAKKQNELLEIAGLILNVADVQINAFAEENATVLFCNPFDSYMSLLAQYCFARSRKLREVVKKTEYMNFVYERSAICNYRLQSVRDYCRSYANLKLSEKLSAKDVYEGIFVCKTVDGNAMFLVNKNIGVVESDSDFKHGQKVRLLFDDITRDCLNLKYKLSD